MNNFDLISGKPILIEGIGKLYQPKIKDIEEIGFEEYNKKIAPFFIPLDEFIKPEFLDQIKYLDIFFMAHEDGSLIFQENNFSYLDLLIQSLEFFFKEKITVYAESQSILIGKNGLIDRNNFDNVIDAIYKINLSSKSKNTQSKPLSDKQKEIHNKLAKYRKKYEAQNTMQFEDIINIVMYGGDSFIPYEQIENMTYYQLYNAYNVISTKNNYRDYLLHKTSEKFDVKEDVEHWSITIKKFLTN